MYYIPDKSYLYCHNCGVSKKDIAWAMDITGKTYNEIVIDSECNKQNINNIITKIEQQKPIVISSTLPDDSINLFDKQQIDYYFNNKIIRDALQFIKKRRLDVAINRPKALYISLKDMLHKNRLCIPFYNEKGKITYYQTRAIYKSDEKDKPKYISKMNSDKTIFGIKNITPELGTIFIFEGPIDSMFCCNSIAVGGIHLSELQEEQLSKYKFLNRIWVLDNELKTNKQVKEKMIKLIEAGESVFIWPAKFKMFKDINEICMKYNLNQISPSFFIENAHSGAAALSKIEQI
jgi:hypothetical protein